MIKTFYTLLSKVGITKGQDKILHLIVGFIVGLISILFFYKTILPIIIVICVAVGKELFDKYIKKTYFDFFDFFATIAGGTFGIMAGGAFLG